MALDASFIIIIFLPQKLFEYRFFGQKKLLNILLKCGTSEWLHQQAKRNSDELDYRAESSVYAEAVASPFCTPVSGKVARTSKTSRAAKSNRLGPQAPVLNSGLMTFTIWTHAFYDAAVYYIFRDIEIENQV